MSRARFKISNEGDCERVAKVFRQWVSEDSAALSQGAVITVPNPKWASIFSEIYADEISNWDLADEAEQRIIDVVFEVDGPFGIDVATLDDDELQDLLDQLLDELEDEKDEDEDDDA